MTPDELWHQHTDGMGVYMIYEQFLAALHEYGQAVRARDAEIAEEMALYAGQDISIAIQREELP